MKIKQRITDDQALDLVKNGGRLEWSPVASEVKPENVFNVVFRKGRRVYVMTGYPDSFRACQVIISKLMDYTRPYCAIEPIAPVVAFYDLPKSFQDRAYRDRQGAGEDYTRKRYFVIGGDLYCLDDIEEEHGHHE